MGIFNLLFIIGNRGEYILPNVETSPLFRISVNQLIFINLLGETWKLRKL